jgi:single-strand DNA-binding protein
LNKIFLIGRLTKDPDLKYLPNGTPKAELRLATSRQYVTNNEKREDTCYVDVIAWSRQAEIVNQYLRKGSQIFVEGRLDYQEWEGQDGSRRSKHQVVADRVQFLDTRGGGSEMESGEMNGSAGGGGTRNFGRGAVGGTPAYAGRPAMANAGTSERPRDAATASSGPAEAGHAPAPGGVSESMGIADDDIPF